MLAVLVGQESPKNADIEQILSSVGIEVDSERLTLVVNELSDKSIEQLIKDGRENLSSMPVGGGAVAAESKKPEKEEKKEESESKNDDMGFGDVSMGGPTQQPRT